MTCLAQTTTAWRLMSTSTQHFVPQECKKIGNFRFCNIMMTIKYDDELVIRDLCWLPQLDPKDTYRIKFSRFYLPQGVRYQHLCDFSHFQKCDNYVIIPSNVEKIFPISNFPHPGQKYSHMPKMSPGGFPVSSINSVHINVYTHIYI